MICQQPNESVSWIIFGTAAPRLSLCQSGDRQVAGREQRRSRLQSKPLGFGCSRNLPGTFPSNRQPFCAAALLRVFMLILKMWRGEVIFFARHQLHSNLMMGVVSGNGGKFLHQNPVGRLLPPPASSATLGERFGSGPQQLKMLRVSIKGFFSAEM